MFWLRSEDGAVAVIVALLMVLLLGFTAVAIDGAGIYALREQLQNGADAAALAIAQDCAEQTCRKPLQTAQDLVAANLGDAVAQVDTPTFSERPNSVTVTAATTRANVFGSVLGIDRSTVRAAATAEWASPVAGTTALPIAVSWCDFAAQTGGSRPTAEKPGTVALTPTAAKSACTAPSGSAVPAGFGWTVADARSCHATSSSNGHTSAAAGRAMPSSCTADDFTELQDTVVSIPVYDVVDAGGKAASMHVYGYAAFRLTGYNIAGVFRWNAPCAGAATCIRGYFTRSTDLSGSFTSGAGSPDLGLSIITLTR